MNIVGRELFDKGWTPVGAEVALITNSVQGYVRAYFVDSVWVGVKSFVWVLVRDGLHD